MKRFLFMMLIALIAVGCETGCNCEYVVYDKDPGESWKESYRSTWDASCKDETLDESRYTAHDGSVYYSRTEIECY